MTRTVRISREHGGQQIRVICPAVMAFAANACSGPGGCACGAGVLAGVVLRPADQP